MTHLNAVSGSNVAIVVGAVLLLARWARAGPRARRRALRGGPGRLRDPGPTVAERGPGRHDGGDRAGRARRRSSPGRAARPLPPRSPCWCWSTRSWPATPGSRSPCSPPPGCCCSRRAGGTRCAGGAYRPGWPRRWPCRRPPSWPAARWSPACPGTVSLVAVPANLLAVPAIAPATVLGRARGRGVAGLAGRRRVRRLAGELAGLVAGDGGPPRRAAARRDAALARRGAGAPAAGRRSPWRCCSRARRPLVRRLVAVVRASRWCSARCRSGWWPPAGHRRAGWWWPARSGRATRVVLPVGGRPGGGGRRRPGPGRRWTAACAGSAYARCRCWWSATSTPTTSGGIAGVFRGRRVAAVVTPAVAGAGGGAAQVRRPPPPAGGAPVRTGRSGWTYRSGGCDLAVLGPPYPLRGTRSDPNNNSLVLRATVAGVRDPARRATPRPRSSGRCWTAPPPTRSGPTC